MSRAAIYELIGYAGSVLVVISLMMQSLWRLRIINLIGAAVFTVYAVLIRSWPVAVVNGVIVVIDIWYLWRMSVQEDYFSTLEIQPDSAYLAKFLDFYADDIARYMPDAAPPDAGATVFAVLRNAVPVGVWVARQRDDATWQLDMDYVIPRYRDSKAGRYLYGTQSPLPAGITLITEAPVAAHERYLRDMGFEPDGGGRLRKTVG